MGIRELRQQTFEPLLKNYLMKFKLQYKIW